MTTRNACILLGLVFLILTYFTFWSYIERTVLIAYEHGALHWLVNQNLYELQGQDFVYLPQSAMLYIPFTYIHPAKLAHVIWRALWMLLMAYSLYKTCAMFVSKDKLGKLFFFVTFITLIISLDAIRNGQLSMAILVLGLLSLVAIYEEKWWLAACYLTLGLAFKTLFIILLLLCLALYPRLRLKLLLLLIIAALIPFLGKNPHYVIAQYQALVANYKFMTKEDAIHATNWAQFFNLFNLVGIHLSVLVQTIIRGLLALGALVICLIAKRSKLNSSQQVMFIYSIAAIYLLLFSSRTEMNSYAILAPVFALYWYQLIFIERNLWLSLSFIILLIGFIGSYYLSVYVFPMHGAWSPPLSCVIFAVILLQRFFSRDREQLFRLQ